jgi:hypothetical protein
MSPINTTSTLAQTEEVIIENFVHTVIHKSGITLALFFYFNIVYRQLATGNWFFIIKGKMPSSVDGESKGIFTVVQYNSIKIKCVKYIFITFVQSLHYTDSV